MSQLKKVVIGGGTGFIGKNLGKLLTSHGYSPISVSRMPGPANMSWEELGQNGLPPNTDAVISLAGQNVMDPSRRWTAGFKQNVWNSRIETTRLLARAVTNASVKPRVFISISGVGIYPTSSTAEYTEESPVKACDFLSELALAWEGEAKLPPETGVRQAVIRSGVVLGREGGMIKQIFLPFYMGVGGPIASGQQYMPWIYIDDLSKLFLFAMENEKVSGVLNGVAPQVVTNGEFTKAFSRALWRLAFFPMPKFALETFFGEERAKMMIEGQKVLPKRVLEYGFKYDYPDIDSACKKCAKLIP